MLESDKGLVESQHIVRMKDVGTIPSDTQVQLIADASRYVFQSWTGEIGLRWRRDWDGSSRHSSRTGQAVTDGLRHDGSAKSVYRIVLHRLRVESLAKGKIGKTALLNSAMRRSCG